jgi:hypothetical protein
MRRLLWSQIRRNERTRFRGSMGRPLRVVNTRPVSRQARPNASRSVVCCSWAGEQGGASLGWNGQVPVARLGLDWAGSKLCAHPPDLLSDPELARVQVDILPPQARDLTAAHSVQQQEDKRRVERVRLSCLEEGQSFVG